ncbi:hypothetical protein D8682_01350 [Buttiauxella sp. 3AFRM03]|uniref:hypothetical protein n=1 Tax=Buttiauxella sp. 3AFRM03 TaxID=2479367 RepID=UPI000EF815D2|nr:hypothetical protein [Buttiauxella sp. 3AFRM03]AYN25747.1 hypothetical protein D8682_01350 [Buttiauxella sp. 3AFRM03]
MTTSPLKVEDSQAQFEAWCKTVMSDDSDFCMEWGDYINLNVRLRWEAWKAARRAIVVDIASHTEFEIEHMISPEKDGYSTGWIDGRNYAASQVRAAGITVKGDSDG